MSRQHRNTCMVMLKAINIRLAIDTSARLENTICTIHKKVCSMIGWFKVYLTALAIH